MLDKIYLKNIMVREPYTLKVIEPFSRVEEMLRTYNIRHLPVVDEHNVLCGIVTQRDLYRITSPRRTMDGHDVYSPDRLNAFILEHVMTRDVVSLTPDATLYDALSVMVRNKYGCVPIVDDEKHLVGILTQIDVLRAIAGWFEI